MAQDISAGVSFNSASIELQKSSLGTSLGELYLVVYPETIMGK